MQKIVTFLWFNTQAEEAMNYYCGIFKNAKPGHVGRQGPNGPVFTVEFEIEGQKFIGLNGGPQYPFTPAISLFVNCENQAEVDDLWAKLGEDGSIQQCGWLQDKFGLSWQIIPTALMRLMKDPDPKKSAAVMQAMLKMRKIVIAELEAAYAAA